MKFSLSRSVTYFWYELNSFSYLYLFIPLLYPLSSLYRLLAAAKRALYQRGWRRAYRSGVPVVVIGNITVGGSGKTPFVIALVRWLKAEGFNPGVIARGYGGTQVQATAVHANSDPAVCGDEAVLIAMETQVPVVIAKRRAHAAQYLLANNECDIILSDDGLQHYALQRDLELVLLDEKLGLGNGHCLPLGPLRESIRRLTTVDQVLVRQQEMSLIMQDLNLPNDVLKSQQPSLWKKHLHPYLDNIKHDTFLIRLQAVERLGFAQKKLSLKAFQEQYPAVHAVAGIAHPSHFFQSLIGAGLTLVPHALADHANLKASDLHFNTDLPVIMTSKDAIKCQHMDLKNHWVLAICADIPETVKTQILSLLASQ